MLSPAQSNIQVSSEQRRKRKKPLTKLVLSLAVRCGKDEGSHSGTGRVLISMLAVGLTLSQNLFVRSSI